MTRSLKLIVATGVLLGAFFLSALRAQVREARPLKVGVVDLSTVFNQYSKVDRLRQKASEELLQFRQRIEQLKADKQKECEAASLKLHMVEEGTGEWTKADQELTLQITELQNLDKLLGIRAEVLLARDFQIIYSDIRAAVADFAKKNQYDIILKSDSSELPANRADLARTEISMRGVLYNSEVLDITQEVVQALNRKFETEAAGK